MLNTLGVVEVWGVSRSPPQFAGRRFGDTSLLQWVVRRATESQLLDRVVVISDDGPNRSAVERIVPADICVFPNSASDPLGCFASAVRHFDPRAVVRIPVGNPFLDPVLIDRLIASAVSHPGVDYVSYCRSDGRPVVLSQFGLVAEWCAAAAVEQAEREATDPLDRQNPTRYIYGHPERFALRLIAVPSPLDRTDVRLAVSREEDWEHAQAILEALGPESLDWQRIAQLLDQQPTMRARMEDLNQAEAR